MCRRLRTGSVESGCWDIPQLMLSKISNSLHQEQIAVDVQSSLRISWCCLLRDPQVFSHPTAHPEPVEGRAAHLVWDRPAERPVIVEGAAGTLILGSFAPILCLYSLSALISTRARHQDRDQVRSCESIETPSSRWTPQGESMQRCRQNPARVPEPARTIPRSTTPPGLVETAPRGGSSLSRAVLGPSSAGRQAILD